MKGLKSPEEHDSGIYLLAATLGKSLVAGRKTDQDRIVMHVCRTVQVAPQRFIALGPSFNEKRATNESSGRNPTDAVYVRLG